MVALSVTAVQTNCAAGHTVYKSSSHLGQLKDYSPTDAERAVYCRMLIKAFFSFVRHSLCNWLMILQSRQLAGRISLRFSGEKPGLKNISVVVSNISYIDFL